MAKKSLYEEAHAHQREGTGPVNGVVKAYFKMSPRDQRALLQILEDPKITNATVSHVLTSRGYPVSPDTVRRYRNGTAASASLLPTYDEVTEGGRYT